MGSVPGRRSQWVGPTLIILGLLGALLGAAGLIFSGICGFEADAQDVATCYWRWRLGGGMLTGAGIIGLARGAWLARRDRDGER